MINDENTKAVIFDFDGVVVNSEPYYEAAIGEVLSEYGIKISEDEWDQFKGLADEKFYELLESKFDLHGEIEEINERIDRSLRKKVIDLNYIPGFKDFYDFINKNYKTGLVTSTSSNHLEWLFKNTVIEDLFDLKVTACDIENSKPHPEPYEKMANMLSISPENITVIEDSVNGVKSANKAGMKTIGLLTSFKEEEMTIADFIAEDYEELFELFKK